MMAGSSSFVVCDWYPDILIEYFMMDWWVGQQQFALHIEKNIH